MDEPPKTTAASAASPPPAGPAADRAGLVDAAVLEHFCHLVRNVLTGTTFCLEAVRNNLGEAAAEGEAHDAVEGARRGLERTLQAVTRLGEYAFAAQARRGRSAVARQVQAALGPLQPQLVGTAVRVEVEAGLAVGLTEPALALLLGHLLRNAAAALQHPEPGHEPRQLHVGGRTVAPGQAELSVTDSGPGLSAHARRAALEPFHPDRGQPGPGAGLAVCCRLVGAVGGSLRLEDAAPGTRVVVLLPT